MHAHTFAVLRPCDQGFSLAECLCSLALLATLTTWSLPSLHTWVVRTRIEATRETWLSEIGRAHV